ncbi:hypothetical protein B4U37_21655 (plasmid) [Sutcliffiella horikoshii]|uniref:TM2 domain-containing protein n=1 Tax=Sutcliffiella horikoshii TaxID=79883 RepID=A0ABM6KPU6_9BACI|nr:hypothetical protein [Sutcliffiella horikoshii]ART78720.1 hypothetical protein B4U37_21655 [Sutcliffiella horikoshii]
MKKKNVLLGLILNLILPGLGQIYYGNTKKGIMLIFGYLISWVSILIVIGIILLPIIILYSLVDIALTHRKFTPVNA